MTPDELDESNARIQEFIRTMKSIPESERTLLTSDKFSGPVGRPTGESKAANAGPIATEGVEPDADPDDED